MLISCNISDINKLVVSHLQAIFDALAPRLVLGLHNFILFFYEKLNAEVADFTASVQLDKE